MAIDRNGVEPLTVQIVKDLKRRIGSEEFAVGTRLPSLRALSKSYGVAELTVHEAVKQLQRDGVLSSAPGRGTFVSTKPADNVNTTVTPERFAALEVEVSVLAQAVEEIRQKLGSAES